MTPNEIIVALILLLTIIGGVWGGLHVARTNRFNDAAAEFRNAFINILYRINGGETNDRIILQEEFCLHNKARIKFEGYLGGKTLTSFRKTWEAYAKHHQERTNVSVVEMFATEALSIDKLNDEKHQKELNVFRLQQILSHIEALLNFAPIKK